MGAKPPGRLRTRQMVRLSPPGALPGPRPPPGVGRDRMDRFRVVWRTILQSRGADALSDLQGHDPFDPRDLARPGGALSSDDQRAAPGQTLLEIHDEAAGGLA
jgi:hypothetical protein